MLDIDLYTIRIKEKVVKFVIWTLIYPSCHMIDSKFNVIG